MTSNYHTPISTGAAANAQTFNDPLGQMDEALTEALLEERDGHIIQEEGSDLPQKPRLDFVGAGVTVTDEIGKTLVTIPGTSAVLESVVAGTNVTVDNTDPANPIVSSTSGGGVGKSVLPNGGMQVAQRGAGPFTSTTYFANNDDVYLIDGCVELSDGNDVADHSQVADTNYVSGYCWRADIETANKRLARFFPIENKDIQDIRKSGKASIQFKSKVTGSSISNLRALLLAWNGTADAITSDVISAWGSAGSDPTLVANWTKENNGSNLAVNTSVQLFEIENIDVDTSGVTNLGLLIMIDDTDAQVGDYWDIGDVKVESGAVCTEYQNEHIDIVLSKCRRYVRKSYSQVTTPGTATDTGIHGYETPANSTAFVGYSVAFPTMRSAPSVTLFDNAGNVNKVCYTNAGSFIANKAATVYFTSDCSFFVYTDTITAKSGIAFHYLLRAEL